MNYKLLDHQKILVGEELDREEGVMEVTYDNGLTAIHTFTLQKGEDLKQGALRYFDFVCDCGEPKEITIEKVPVK